MGNVRKESDNNIYDLTSLKTIGKCTMKDGHTFKFNKSDYPLISRYKWRFSRGYIVSCPLKGESILKLHRYLVQDKLNLPENKDKLVCFKNHDVLDVRRHNLVIVTKAELRALARGQKNKENEVKGVSYHKARDTWLAYITINGKREVLGTFKYEEQAIIARLNAEHELLGPYAPQKNLFAQYGILTKSGAYSMGERLHFSFDLEKRSKKRRAIKATKEAWEKDGYTSRDLITKYYMDCAENIGFERQLERDLIDTDLVNTYVSRLYIPEAY